MTEITKSWSSRLDDLEVRSDMEIQNDPVLVRFKGVLSFTDVFTAGNISTILGRAKSRKTFFMTLLTAAIIGRRNLHIQSLIDGNVVIFDTEQGRYHVWRMASRLQAMLGTSSHPNRLKIFGLRPLSTAERMEVIGMYLYSHDVQFCFIDGIRDLVTDINDAVQATEIVGKLMKWSFERGTHICNVIHMNKADENARGHIGTEIVNKSETVMSVKRSPENNHITLIESLYTRGPEFKPFSFEIIDGMPQITDKFPEIKDTCPY